MDSSARQHQGERLRKPAQDSANERCAETLLLRGRRGFAPKFGLGGHVYQLTDNVLKSFREGCTHTSKADQLGRNVPFAYYTQERDRTAVSWAWWAHQTASLSGTAQDMPLRWQQRLCTSILICLVLCTLHTLCVIEETLRRPCTYMIVVSRSPI